MAKRRRKSYPRFRDELGKFTSKEWRKRARTKFHPKKKLRRSTSKRSTKTAAYARAGRSGHASTRMLTLLGLGAAAIVATQYLTKPKSTAPILSPAQLAQPRKLTHPLDTRLTRVGPTLPDGTAI